MKIFLYKNGKHYLFCLYFFLLGFFGFSMLGQYVVLNFFHLPFSFMEIYFIPFFFLNASNIIKYFSRILKKQPQMSLLMWSLIVIGIIIGIFETQSISFLLAYRSIIYMLLIYYYVKKNTDKIQLNTFMYLNIFAVIGDLIYIKFISTSQINSSVNCIAIGVAIISAFVLGKYILGCVSFLLGIFLGILSGFRIGIVVSVLCFIEALVFMTFKYNKTLRKRFFKIILLSFFIILVFFIIINYEEIVKFLAEKLGMSSFAIFRITERMSGLLNLDLSSSQDAIRFEIFQYPISNFISSILPRGLIGELTNEYWLYIDVPILYFYDIFGSLFSLGIVLYWSYKMILKFYNLSKKIYKSKIDESMVTLSILLCPLLVMLFIINGSFSVIVFQAVETGILLGNLNKK